MTINDYQFFLQAIELQANENLKKTSEVLKLYETKKAQVVEITHSQYAIHTLDYIFSRPIFKSTDFTGNKEVPAPTAKRIITLLRDNGMLITIRKGSGRRASIYAFKELINVAEGKKVF